MEKTTDGHRFLTEANKGNKEGLLSRIVRCPSSVVPPQFHTSDIYPKIFTTFHAASIHSCARCASPNSGTLKAEMLQSSEVDPWLTRAHGSRQAVQRGPEL